MHPLPRDSRIEKPELDNDLNDMQNLAIFRQANNGIPIRMAIFAMILGVEDKVNKYSKETTWYNASDDF
jgi:aspartate carbamoyltransferase catalytic subunit